MLNSVDIGDWRYDYDFEQAKDEPGASIWIKGPDGKPCINVVIEIDDRGVEVRLWPMDGYENITSGPSGTIHLDFAEVEHLKEANNGHRTA